MEIGSSMRGPNFTNILYPFNNSKYFHPKNFVFVTSVPRRFAYCTIVKYNNIHVMEKSMELPLAVISYNV